MSSDDQVTGDGLDATNGSAPDARAGRPERYRDDDMLPPYAPRTAAGTPFRLPSYTETRWPSATAAPVDLVDPITLSDPASAGEAWDPEDADEEAAAFAEAQQQGLLPAGFAPPVRRLAEPATTGESASGPDPDDPARPGEPSSEVDPDDPAGNDPTGWREPGWPLVDADDVIDGPPSTESTSAEPGPGVATDTDLTFAGPDAADTPTAAIPIPDESALPPLSAAAFSTFDRAYDGAADPDPATSVLPAAANPVLMLPGLDDQSPAARAGVAKENRRQRRQREAATALAAERPRFRDEPVRTTIRGLGQLFITFGVVVLLFVVYEVYITDIFSNQKQAVVQDEMEARWAEHGSATPTTTASIDPIDPVEPTDDPTLAPPAPEQQVVEPAERTRQYTTALGEGFANLYIPVFGVDYVKTVLEGTSTDDLARGPGHYENSQYPGELGNFAVAGHRVSKGSPFSALGTLNSCDAIVVETEDDWFVYRVLPMAEEAAAWNPASRAECADVAPLSGEYQGVVGREITVPSDFPQVLPVPGVNAAGPDAVAAATERLLTLTTCHPQFSDRERMIIHAELVKSYAKADGFMPPELSEV